MARGVAGREIAADERNRQRKIAELLLNTLRRLGGPVIEEWHVVAQELGRVRVSYMSARRGRGGKRSRVVNMVVRSVVEF